MNGVAADTEQLLNSALEKVVYFEARAELLQNESSLSRREVERLSAEVKRAEARELELKQNLAQLEVVLRKQTAELETLKSLETVWKHERVELIGRLADAAGLSGKSATPAELDLAQFISDLRAQVGVPAAVSVASDVQVPEPSPVAALSMADLSSSNPFLREQAARRMAAMKLTEGLPLLVKALAAETVGEVKCALFEALAALGRNEAATVIEGWVGDASPDVRMAAVKALLAIRGPAAAPHLEQALSDRDVLVRRRAAVLLAQLPLAEALTLARRAAQDLDPRVRSLAIPVLSSSADSQDQRLVLSLANDGNGRVRRLAAEAVSAPPELVERVVSLDAARRRRELRRLGERPVGAAAAQEPASDRAPARSSQELEGRIFIELRAALRGRSVEELAGSMEMGVEELRRHCKRLAAEGRLVQRGTRFCVA